MTPSPLGALIVHIDYTGVPVDEWSEWYETDHIPQRMALDGFLTGSWWRALDGSTRSLGLYDLDGIARLSEPAYQAIVGDGATAWTKRLHRLRDAPARPSLRYECVQLYPGREVSPTSEYLMLFAVRVDPAAEPEFHAWYDEEHLPLLRAVPGVVCGRRFRVLNADERLHEYVAVYHLADPEIRRTQAWRAALRTERTQALVPYLRDPRYDFFARPELVTVR
jgi:hypothetical protein